MSDHYQPGELFVYTNGNRWELGMVKRTNYDGSGYFCYYSRGDTAANTPTEHMHKLANAGYTHIEQLLDDATVGNKPKDNPRNYNPDGTPKIPNMNVGADPDWVDWVASLEHKEPLDLKEAVEQFMFEVICFGGEMGPNDCGGEYCPDEGMVYTNDFINGWVNKITATVGAGTCHMEVKDNLAETEGMGEVWLECDECHWQMPLEPTTPRFKHCPNCKRKVVSE